VVGPSGSGKTTLARAIAGLVPRDVPGEWQGSLRVGDLDVASAPPAEVAARVGILFQDPGSQLVMDRAADDVAFGLENRAWPRGDADAVPTALGRRPGGLPAAAARACRAASSAWRSPGSRP
jgi:energy-coupling factor transport system ATP-binding protein